MIVEDPCFHFNPKSPMMAFFAITPEMDERAVKTMRIDVLSVEH